MAVGLVAGGWAILSGRGDSTISGEPTMPPMVGGGAPCRNRPPAQWFPIRLRAHGRTADERWTGFDAGDAGRGGQVSVSGVGEERTIACTDNGVTISGVSNKVVLSGHCSLVDVSGVENTVTIESADAIGVSGLNNHVTFHPVIRGWTTPGSETRWGRAESEPLSPLVGPKATLQRQHMGR